MLVLMFIKGSASYAYACVASEDQALQTNRDDGLYTLAAKKTNNLRKVLAV